MTTAEVLVGLRGLKADTVCGDVQAEQILLRWAADGILPLPSRDKDGGYIWKPRTVELAAAAEVLIFMHGFAKDSVQAAVAIMASKTLGKDALAISGATFDEPPAEDIILYVERFVPREFRLACEIWLVAYGKACLGFAVDHGCAT